VFDQLVTTIYVSNKIVDSKPVYMIYPPFKTAFQNVARVFVDNVHERHELYVVDEGRQAEQALASNSMVEA
jgi:hypothetical protein